ncbi:uncharacterized protein LOC135130694 isoform X1 [Zophobas morio]|uniref:uncharacterized protein LOC135130694 isoform X1 n=1 Tax=Zophobas morio TaxID=2755281 RepID=UPI003082DCB1
MKPRRQLKPSSLKIALTTRKTTAPNLRVTHSVTTPADCFYEIHKLNSDICRLRIHAKFFWLGRSTNCAESFLEIDGKYICGCKSDLKIIAPFEGYSTKILRFVSGGQERSSYSGFIVEVIQDECPKKVIPESNSKNKTVEKKFRFYNDQINRVAWPNKSDDLVVEKLHLISENTEIIKDDHLETHGQLQPQVVRNVYFYSFPDINRIPHDREDTEYVDTSSKTSFNQDNFDYNYCRSWNQEQFNSISLRNLPVCKNNEGTIVERKCFELNQIRGYFKSPGYPFYYLGNKNFCYKFRKLPGYCTIRVFMKDFDLQDSVTCENDYVLFANQLRYCGRRLANTISTLDVRNKLYEQMNFVTDALFCGRGFFGAYEQIPCQEFPHPINPTDPTGTTPPYVPPTMTPCSKTVREEMFTFDVYDYNEPSCMLVIKKNTEYVCSVKIYFEKFDLVCAWESLVIDGTRYCGNLTGESVNIEVTNRDPIIVYRRFLKTDAGGLRLKLTGTQVSDDCPYPEVPAERFIKPKSLNWTDVDSNRQFILKFGDRFKNICGVITNTTESKLPETFCELIMKEHNNVTDCVPLKENSLIVPFNSQKLELKIRDAQETEEIEFQEIDCDDLSKNSNS